MTIPARGKEAPLPRSQLGAEYIVCGRTDMRKGIRGLATLVQQNYQMDPTDSSLFLFCVKSRSQLKALLWEPDGFILLSKQLSTSRYWKS